MGDYLLLAGPATQPERLLAYLASHPDIAAVSDSQLGQRLYTAARSRVRRYRSSESGGELLDAVSHGRSAGGAAFMRFYEEARAASGASVVVLHDPSGPLFPFPEPPPIALLVLVRTAESAAAVVGAHGIERVVAAARDALSAFTSRVSGFGVPVERILTVEEDRLESDPERGLGEVCRMLGVADDRRTVTAMLAPSPVDARSETGA